MLHAIISYFSQQSGAFFLALIEHVGISALSVFIAAGIGVPAGILCARDRRVRAVVTGVFATLRVIPSLAVLFLCVVLLKVTGLFPAVLALTILALPPMLINTTIAFSTLPAAIVEAGVAMGMSPARVFWQVKIPLAMPLIFTGLRTAIVEVIASATLAAYIGAGGLGTIIFTGFQLMDNSLLVIGGVSVACLSLATGWLLGLLQRRVLRFQHPRAATNIRRDRMKNIRRALLVTLGVLTLISTLVIAGCGSKGAGTTTSASAPIRVGSKNFTESLILGNLYADALEDNDLKVDRKLNLADTVVHTALTGNQIDLYPEYTGTGLLSILKLPLQTDPQKVYDTVKADYQQKWNIVWLDYAPANDSQGLAITKAAADKYGITDISDLQKHATELRFATQGEFDQRADGLPALAKAYGPFKWKSEKIYDTSLLATVMLNGQADVAPLYTTAGDLANPKLVALKDDKQVWPPYNVAPVVRGAVLKAHPTIATILNSVDKTLTTEKLTALNAKVDVDKQEADKVASDYYASIRAQVRDDLSATSAE
ncbi:MAG: ABC transporter permease subunit [Coriobacteriia bacterium]|nr:ABC transporter permease subunit [Coriobacteriia bacterium]